MFGVAGLRPVLDHLAGTCLSSTSASTRRSGSAAARRGRFRPRGRIGRSRRHRSGCGDQVMIVVMDMVLSGAGLRLGGGGVGHRFRRDAAPDAESGT